MTMKRYTCRSHPGGIFSIPARRGRPPVRCNADHPCDKSTTVENNVRDVPGVGRVAVVTQTKSDVLDFDKMTNAELKAYAREHFSTIGKITSRAQMITALRAQLAKSTPEAVAQGAKSVTLAMKAKEQLEAVGWVVKGSAAMGIATITASRDAETLVMSWRDGELLRQEYSMEFLKPQDNNIPDNELHFNPDELTDSELVRMIKGMKVTWWNTLASSRESAIIGGNITVEHIFYASGDEDNSKRIVKFLDHSGGGFRAFHVSAILKVG